MMNDMLKEKCDLLLENIRVLRKAFWYENNDICLCSAMMLTMAGKKAAPEELKATKKILTERAGVFSNLRGYAKLPVVIGMYNSGSPVTYCADVIENYGVIKRGRINRTSFDVLAAMVLTDTAAEHELDTNEVVDRMNRIYKEMRRNHPLLTGREDMPSAMLLALSGKPEEEVLRDMEDCYARLKPGLSFHRDYVQTMSAVLAVLEGENSDKCFRLENILQALKIRGRSLNNSMYLPVAAGLVPLNDDTNEIADRILEISDYLAGKKGFKLSGKWKRTAYGAMLMMSEDPGNTAVNSAVLSSAVTNVIISEIIMTIVIMSAATSSTSSSSN
ncbi:MAG: hypothetical protein CW338_03205 [Clostridiales bacterium]|nr:hypothetical protein [Clostridiales bacterium]